MTFLEAEERFQKLEEARRAGKLTYPQYVEAVHALRVVDDAGLVWMLQEQTGQWFVFTGGNWVAARPPVSAPPSPPPPPPAEPEIVSAPEPEVAPAAVEPAAEVEAPAEPEPAAAAEPEPIPPTAPLEPEAELPAHLKKPAPIPGRGAGASALPPHLRASGELPPHLRASGAVRAPIPAAPAPAARVPAPAAPTPAARVPAPAAPAPATKPAAAARTPVAPKSTDSPKTGRYFLWFIIIWLVIAVVVYLIWGREQPGVLLGVALAAAGSFVWLLVTLNRSWSGEIVNIKTEQVYSADDDGGDWEDITYAYVRQPNGKIRKERWIQGWEVGDRLEKRRGEAEIRCIHPNQ